MGKLNDLSDRYFERLHVLYKLPIEHGIRNGRKYTKPVKYRCVCECGKVRDVLANNLLMGITKSCGCIRNEVTRLTKEEKIKRELSDMGRTLGNLTIIGIGEPDKKGETRYICICECGKEFTSRASNIRDGHTKSCGCKKGQAAKRTAREKRRHAGVYQNTSGNWSAYIFVKGRCVYLGTKDSEGEALKLKEDKLRSYVGDTNYEKRDVVEPKDIDIDEILEKIFE